MQDYLGWAQLSFLVRFAFHLARTHPLLALGWLKNVANIFLELVISLHNQLYLTYIRQQAMIYVVPNRYSVGAKNDSQRLLKTYHNMIIKPISKLIAI